MFYSSFLFLLFKVVDHIVKSVNHSNLNYFVFAAATHNSKIGFREVELVQDPLENGTSFYFKVNGQKIWAKGANWIPADAFSSRVDPNTYYQFLRSMVAANMNMIRVWGGGRYQDSGFYQFCDQLGLLVWQETMFACATYRTDSEFLSSVKEEVKHQVLRLQHHPSICLWSTNNENEAMLAENWFFFIIRISKKKLIILFMCFFFDQV